MAYSNQQNQQKKPDDYSDIIDEEFYSSGDAGRININKMIQNHVDRISRYIFGGGMQTEYTQGSKGQTFAKNAERKEVVIEAVRFLEALMKDKYDQEMDEAQLQIDERDVVEEERFFNIQLDKEAQRRAMMSMKKASSSEDYEKSYLFWRDKIKGLKIQAYDKSSPEFEYYLTVKHRLSLDLLEELMLLLSRLDWGAEEEYTE